MARSHSADHQNIGNLLKNRTSPSKFSANFQDSNDFNGFNGFNSNNNFNGGDKLLVKWPIYFPHEQRKPFDVN